MTDLRLVPDQPASLSWVWVERVQFMRDTFASEIKGADELAWFAQVVALLGEPARLLSELEVGMGERSEDVVRRQAAMGLLFVAAACVEVSERLLEPGS